MVPPVPPVVPPPPSNNVVSHGGSSDFEAGQLFERYNKGGGNTLEKDQFQKLLSDLKNGSAGSNNITTMNSGPLNVIPQSNTPDQFMVGRIFERYIFLFFLKNTNQINNDLYLKKKIFKSFNWSSR